MDAWRGTRRASFSVGRLIRSAVESVGAPRIRVRYSMACARSVLEEIMTWRTRFPTFAGSFAFPRGFQIRGATRAAFVRRNGDPPMDRVSDRAQSGVSQDSGLVPRRIALPLFFL